VPLHKPFTTTFHKPSKEISMFHRILVAVDNSPDATQALTQAIDLARTEHAHLTLMTGVAQVPASAYLEPGAPISSMTDDARASAETILSEALLAVPSELSVTTVLTDKPIRAALIDQIHTGEYDLVLMGSRGRGAVRSGLLGSVSHYVLNHSRTPVLIVQAEASQDAGPVGNTQRPHSTLRPQAWINPDSARPSALATLAKADPRP
jgi:nucleotide-binding universal stress UspA family protein